MAKTLEYPSASLQSFWLHSSATAAAVAAAVLICVVKWDFNWNIFVNTFHTVLFCTHLVILLVKTHNLSNENGHPPPPPINRSPWLKQCGNVVNYACLLDLHAMWVGWGKYTSQSRESFIFIKFHALPPLPTGYIFKSTGALEDVPSSCVCYLWCSSAQPHLPVRCHSCACIHARLGHVLHWLPNRALPFCAFQNEVWNTHSFCWCMVYICKLCLSCA